MAVNNFVTGACGIEIIKHFEGFKERAYLCPAGVWTIGYGHTKNVAPKQVITSEQGETLLKEDLKEAEKAVNNAVTVPLTQYQFDALVSFTFNLGADNLKHSTLLKRINSKEFSEAAAEFLRWNKVKNREVSGLTKRRRVESHLFTTGELVFEG